MSTVHVIKLQERTGRIEVTEEATRVVFKLRFDKYGDFTDIENESLERWLMPIFERYNNDPRPSVIDNPTTGEIATVYGGMDHGIVMIQQGDAQHSSAHK